MFSDLLPHRPRLGMLAAMNNSPSNGSSALQFLLLFFAGWVNRSQQQVIEYLKRRTVSFASSSAAARAPRKPFHSMKYGLHEIRLNPDAEMSWP